MIGRIKKKLLGLAWWHVFIPSSQEAGVDRQIFAFKVSLVYIVSSRPHQRYIVKSYLKAREKVWLERGFRGPEFYSQHTLTSIVS